jgi:outer membrane protein assembly factor BamB
LPRRIQPAVALCLALLALSACRPPEADYWADRRERPRPFSAVQFQVAWDRDLPFCPSEMAVDPGAGATLTGSGRSLTLDSGGNEVPAPESAPAPEELSAEQMAVVGSALDRIHDGPVETTPAVLWRELALVGVPETGTLHAVDLRKGRVRWSVRTAGRLRAAAQVYHSRVLLQSLDNHLYCLYPDNGHEAWRALASHRLSRAASFWRDRILLIPETSTSIQAFDLFDGTPAGKWTLPHEDVAFSGAPVVLDDLVLAPYAVYGSSSCSLVALRLLEGKPLPRTAAPSMFDTSR